MVGSPQTRTVSLPPAQYFAKVCIRAFERMAVKPAWARWPSATQIITGSSPPGARVFEIDARSGRRANLSRSLTRGDRFRRGQPASKALVDAVNHPRLT
jgi:hypothetical protein